MIDAGTVSQSLFLGLQPILDSKQDVVAYELLFRSGQTNAANVADDMLATAGQRGYLMWRFRPVRGGMWNEVSDDATLLRCEARVLAQGEGGVVLDRTVFYARGGGQPGDTGVLRWAGGEMPVADIASTSLRVPSV